MAAIIPSSIYDKWQVIIAEYGEPHKALEWAATRWSVWESQREEGDRTPLGDHLLRFPEELTSPEQDNERRRLINEATNKAQAQMKAAEDFQRDWNLNHV